MQYQQPRSSNLTDSWELESTLESESQKEIETSLPVEEDELTAGARKEAQLAVLLPPDMRIIEEARKLASDRNSRINSLVQTISEDPVTTLAVLHAANTSTTAGPRSPTTRLRSAIVRLGSGSTLELLDQLQMREAPSDPEVRNELENLRHLSTQISAVAELISTVSQPALSDTAKTAGLLSQLAYMIACSYFGTEYVQLSNGRSRSLVTYRLLSDYRFNTSLIIMDYLNRYAIPEEMGDIFSTEEKPRPPGQVHMRFMIRSAAEVVEAFVKGKWQRYTNIGELPSQSSLRLLKLTANDYLQLHELVTGYLQPPDNKEKAAEDDEKTAEAEVGGETLSDIDTKGGLAVEAETETERMAQELLAAAPEEIPAVEIPGEVAPEEIAIDSSATEDTLLSAPAAEVMEPIFAEMVATEEEAAIAVTSIGEMIEEQELEAEELPQEKKDLIECLSDICSVASSADELLANVINKFVEYGPYNRALILSVNSERSAMNVNKQAGERMDDTAPIVLKDPLSPFALGSASFRSFCPSGAESRSPLGAGAYALAPIATGSQDSQTFMYVDCGQGAPLPFDARKVFRMAIEMINRKLPELGQ